MAKACHPYLRKYDLFMSHGINKCTAKKANQHKNSRNEDHRGVMRPRRALIFQNLSQASAFANVEQSSVRGKLYITLESRQDTLPEKHCAKIASPPTELHQKPPWDINITINMTIKLKSEMKKEGGVNPNKHNEAKQAPAQLSVREPWWKSTYKMKRQVMKSLLAVYQPSRRSHEGGKLKVSHNKVTYCSTEEANSKAA